MGVTLAWPRGQDYQRYPPEDPWHVCVQSCFSHAHLFEILWTVASRSTLSMGFSRQEYWSGLPCPPPGDLPDPGTEPVSLAAPALQADSSPQSHWGGPHLCPSGLRCLHQNLGLTRVSLIERFQATGLASSCKGVWECVSWILP